MKKIVLISSFCGCAIMTTTAQINRMRTTTNSSTTNNNITSRTILAPPQGITPTANSCTSMRMKLPFSNAERDYMVQKIGHFYVLNGDIIVGDDFPKTRSFALTDADKHWSNATIPVVIDASIYDKGLGSAVHNAINEFNNKTEICIVPRTTEKDYVKIVFSSMIPGAGLSSIGRQGGEQQIFLSASANAGNVMHEMLHSAGFYHEQGRDDRDNYVSIKSENIISGQENQFQKEASGVMYGSYDYCSIMHYSQDAFSKNGQPTIACVQDGKTIACPLCIGNRKTFSDQDIKGIYALWGNNISRFPCQTVFPFPNYQPPHFATNMPAASDAAMQAFRFRAQVATRQGFVGAYPNFYEARSGKDIVGGTIFLKSTVAIWQDVPLSELGNPPLNDFGARMRATAEYATRNGFVGGFPNFFTADYGKGTVCGTILISNAGAEWRDVPLSELGNPPLDDIGARMRSANDYAVKHGYLSGFPNFFHADYGKGIVCGIILIKKEGGEWRDVTIVEGPR